MPIRNRLRASVPLLFVLLNGCAAQTGLSGGTHLEYRGPDQALWSGHVALLKTPAPSNDGIVLGAEIDGKVGVDEGTRYLGGLRLGYGWAPKSYAESVGCELHLDLGSELTHAGILEDWNGYIGGTVAAVIWLGGDRTTTDLNGEQWVMKPMPELVLFTRARASNTPNCDNHEMCLRGTFELGVALRMALLSELL